MVTAALVRKRRLQHQRRLQRGPRYLRPCALAHRLLHRHRALFRRHPHCRPQALQKTLKQRCPPLLSIGTVTNSTPPPSPLAASGKGCETEVGEACLADEACSSCLSTLDLESSMGLKYPECVSSVDMSTSDVCSEYQRVGCCFQEWSALITNRMSNEYFVAVLECQIFIDDRQHCSLSSCSSSTGSDGSSSPAPAYSGRDPTPAPADAILAGTNAPVAEESTSGGLAGDASKTGTHSPSWTCASGAVGAAFGGLVMVATMVFL